MTGQQRHADCDRQDAVYSPPHTVSCYGVLPVFVCEAILETIPKSVQRFHMRTTKQDGVLTHRMESAPQPTKRTPPRAPVRAMRVLEALSHEKDGMSLAAISVELEVPKTSALHLLRALEVAGYVRRTPAGFVLGARKL
ncbi:helix-turn-helix domain-containing protein (plasmid) [Cupriavidus basilensis]